MKGAVMVALASLVLLLAATALAVPLTNQVLSNQGVLNARSEDWIDMSAESSAKDQQNAGSSDEKNETSASVTPLPSTANDAYSRSCMGVPFAVCVGSVEDGAVSAYAAAVVPKGLVGHWNFDDSEAQDLSLGMNALTPVPEFGPGYLGSGASFKRGSDPNAVYSIPHQSEYNSDEYTVAFWVFLERLPADFWGVLVQKGTDANGSPSILVNAETRTLHVKFRLNSVESANFESASTLSLRRWTHVGLVVDGRLAQLYINGVLDREALLARRPERNEEPIYLASDPFHAAVTSCFIDDLRWYSTIVGAEDMQSLANGAFPGIDVSFCRLGCQSCTREKALKSCGAGYRLCSMDELYSGGLSVARVMGWFDVASVTPWASDDNRVADGQRPALCCIEPVF